MARQRRGGFKTPELKGTLGTLLRTTREVLERGVSEGRSRLDEALAGRRRTDALAELGEIVLDLIRRGEIDVAELPEVGDIVRHLDEVDASHDREPHDREPRDAIATPSSRRRFDERRRDDDGTVSSDTWAPPTRTGKPGAPKVWRPGEDATARERPAVRRTSPTVPGINRKTAGPGRPAIPGASGGGISFDDDSDLAEYMHPDDVPPKDPPEGDS